MTTEEVKGMIGQGVQTQDGSIQGKLTAMHGTCAVIKTAARTLWIDTARTELVPYELPAEQPVQAQVTEADAAASHAEMAKALDWQKKPVEDNPAATAVAEAQVPAQQIAPAIKIEQPVTTEQKPADTNQDNTAPSDQKADATMAQVPNIKWDEWREKVSGVLYDVLGFGWMVIYKGEVCRVAWISTDGNIGILYHKECYMFPIDSDELS